MYRLDEHAINAILSQPPGIPIDAEGREQFTLTRIPRNNEFSLATSLNELFANLDRNDMQSLEGRLENFNLPEQIDDLNKSNQ